MENKTTREIIKYEYRFESTPKYLSDDINEFWEVHKVFHSWLDNGRHNFIVVLRRPLLDRPTSEKGESK